MGYDPDACILCNRCVRYTQEVMQCSALSLEGRGPEARIVPTHGRFLARHGVRALRRLPLRLPDRRHLREVRGGRAGRPERTLEKVKTTCTFCGVGCQIDLNVDPETKRIVKVTSDPTYVPNEGNLCVKGRFAFNFVHHPDRLTEPLVRGEDGELHETTWEHALGGGRPGTEGGEGAARAADDRLPRVGAADDGGELPRSRSSHGRWWEPTPSTPAKPPDTLRLFTAWSGR